MQAALEQHLKPMGPSEAFLESVGATLEALVEGQSEEVKDFAVDVAVRTYCHGASLALGRLPAEGDPDYTSPPTKRPRMAPEKAEVYPICIIFDGGHGESISSRFEPLTFLVHTPTVTGKELLALYNEELTKRDPEHKPDSYVFKYTIGKKEPMIGEEEVVEMAEVEALYAY